MSGAAPDDPEVRRPLRLGVSSCLLGERVRWDGNHKRDRFVVDELGSWADWVPVCPEVEVGMGIPRPTVRLERPSGDPEAGPRMVDPKSGRDWTDRMDRYARRRAARLAKLDLDGYVLKRDSPSCGMERVKVYGGGGAGRRDGTGLFAARLREALPDLPVEEEGRLNDPRLRENFVERIFAYRRVKQLFAPRWRARDVVAFHTAHKLQIMAHQPQAYRELGRLVAGVKDVPRREFPLRYVRGFMAALSRMATPGRNANTLQHMAGHLRDHLDAEDRRELADLIDRYRRGQVPLVVPITLLRHHARRHRVAYLQGQVYLDPHPAELMLRNHV